MSEKALSAFKRDPRKFFGVDFLRIRECENRRVLANISTVLPDSDEDCVPQRHSRRAFWLIYYVSTIRTSPLFVPSRVALFRQSHPGPCYSPRINLVAWRGQISFLMLISRCSFRSLWRSWKEIIKTIRKFVCKYECLVILCAGLIYWAKRMRTGFLSWLIISSETYMKMYARRWWTFLFSNQFLYTRNNWRSLKIFKYLCNHMYNHS